MTRRGFWPTVRRYVPGHGPKSAFRRRGRDLATHAEAIRLPEIKGGSGATLRPSGIAYDVAGEFDAYGDEVAVNVQADGVRASRAAHVREALISPQADAARALTDMHIREVDGALTASTTAQNDLTSFVRRRPKDAKRYERTRLVLLLGDAAGVLGAAIYMGEIPIVAAGQAVAAGLAAVTAGQVGADVRELRLARSRRALVEVDLIDAEIPTRYPRLFGPPVGDATTYGLALSTAALIVALLGISIFALRFAIEGMAGVVFGGLAIATAAASFINSWSYADDVADVLEVYAARAARAVMKQRQLASAPEPGAQQAARAEAVSIAREFAIRAEAKSHGVRALKFEVYRRNPQVFGNGYADAAGLGRTYRFAAGSQGADPAHTADGNRASAARPNRYQPNGHAPL